MWKNTINIDKILKESKISSEVKFAGWKEVQNKALRLRDERRVTIVRDDADIVAASVRGEGDTYDVSIYRQDPDSRSVTTWDCSCPWGQNAFKQKKKNFNGRLCAHALAVLLEANSKKKRRGPAVEETSTAAPVETV